MAAIDAVTKGFEVFGNVLETVTGFSFSMGDAISDVNDQLAERAELEKQLAAGEITQEEFDESTADLATDAASGAASYVEEQVAAAVQFAQTFISAMPQILTALIAELPKLLDALMVAVPMLINELTERMDDIIALFLLIIDPLITMIMASLPALFGSVVKMIPKFIMEIVKAVPALVEGLAIMVVMLIEELPAIVTALVALIPVLIDAVLSKLPMIITALIDAFPLILTAVTDAVPDIVMAVIENLPAIFVALLDGLIQITGDLLVWLFTELPVMLFDLVGDLFTWIGNFFKDVFTEILSLGTAETNTFGDTPGVVRAGASGMVAGFAPNDYIVAAQDPAKLLSMAMKGVGAGMAGMASSRLTAGTMEIPGIAGLAQAVMQSSDSRGSAASNQSINVVVQADGQVLDSVLYRAGQLGKTPKLKQEMKKSNGGVHFGFYRGNYKP